MLLAILGVILFVAFLMSYDNLKNEVHKTKKERVKRMQTFCFTWVIVIVIAVFVYTLFCYLTNTPVIPYIF